MIATGWPLAVLALATAALVAVLALRPRLTQGRGGWLLSFLGLFVLPVVVTGSGVAAHLEHAKSTEFCLSCHEMEPFGETLWIDDSTLLTASHFQNLRVSRDTACYDCHTDYTMFGDVQAKLRGARHLWVHYTDPPEDPMEIELYSPYQNRECLHCHAGARSYTENPLHADMLEELATGAMSCLDCHGPAHPLDQLGSAERWHPVAVAGEGAATVDGAEGGEEGP